MNKFFFAFPGVAHSMYGRACRKKLPENSVLLLSFDCDTPGDSRALEQILPFLDKLDIRASFAVPGELLLENRGMLEDIAGRGHEIIGHGFRRHAEVLGGSYHSTFYYHNLNDEELRQDILQGNSVIEQATGRYPRGFRIPHFGRSSSRSELARVYRVLQTCGCVYSSSTLPLQGLLKGPVYRTPYGIFELPVSGRFDAPLSVLDTYSFGFRSGNHKTFDLFLDNIKRFVAYHRHYSVCLNCYADPSQAVAMEEWFAAIQHVMNSGYTSMSLEAFVHEYADATR